MIAKRLAAACVSGSLLGLCQSARGVEAEDFLLFSREPVTIKPQFDLVEVYNDNLFSQRGSGVADLITTLSPGVDFLIGRKQGNFVALSYAASENFYADNSNLNSTEHLIQLNGQVEFKRAMLRGSDRIQFQDSPINAETKLLEIQSGDQPIYSGIGKIQRTVFADNYTLNYSFSEKTAAYAQVMHYATDYEKGTRLLDYQTLGGVGGFGYRAWSKLAMFGETTYGITTTTPNIPAPALADLTFMGGGIGLRGMLTPKLIGQARFGYEVREFEGRNASFDSPVVNIGLDYTFSEKTSSSFNYSRRQDVSLYAGEQLYTSDVVGAQVSQMLGSSRKWRVNGGGYFGFYDYPGSGTQGARGYEVYTLNFSVAYQIRLWLSASLGFDRTSVLVASSEAGGYDINRLTFRLAAGY